MEVFRLLVSGAKIREIARITGLTRWAVAARRARILEILQAETIFEAAQKARAWGIL